MAVNGSPGLHDLPMVKCRICPGINHCLGINPKRIPHITVTWLTWFEPLSRERGKTLANVSLSPCLVLFKLLLIVIKDLTTSYQSYLISKLNNQLTTNFRYLLV